MGSSLAFFEEGLLLLELGRSDFFIENLFFESDLSLDDFFGDSTTG